MEKSTIDIVERLRGLPIVVTKNGRTGISRMGGALLSEAADEIERLREDLDLIKKMARAEIDAKLRYAAALRNIADIEHEDLAAPKLPAEAVLWVCLDRCVTLAENALKWKE